MPDSTDSWRPRSPIGSGAVGLFLAALAASLPARVEAGKLHVAIERLPCPRRDHIASQVERRAADFMGPHPDLALLVGLGRPGHLSLQLFGAHTVWERSVPFAQRDCAELGDLLLLLVRDWVSREWSAPEPMPEAPAPRMPVAGDLDLRAPPASPPAPARLEIALLGGAFIAVPTAEGGPVATLSVGRDLVPGLGVAVELGYRGSSSTAVAAGRLTARLYTLGAAARLRLRPGPAVGLELLAGPALERLSVHSQDIPSPGSATRHGLALVSSARIRLQLSAGLAWLAGLEVDVRNANDHLTIDGWPQQLVVPPLRLLLLTGVALEVF